jgi:hypothetical protein
MPRPSSIRRHAILKRQYRRAFSKTPGFGTLSATDRWAALREQVRLEAPGARSDLLDILDSREARRDEVLAALEEGRIADL